VDRLRGIGLSSRRRRLAGLGAGVLLLAGAGCSSRLGAPEPGSRQAGRVLDLWRVLFFTGVGVGGVVLGLIAWSLVRYRRREGGQAASFSENVRLELLYTAIPVVIVAVLFGITVGVQRNVTHLSAEPDLRIEVTGFQWGWRFRYLTEGITIVGTSREPPTMLLPLGATARLILRSPDVIHSFWVPAFLFKMDVIPGRYNHFSFTPTRIGTYDGRCAELCGVYHSRMLFNVKVVDQAEYEQHISELKSRGNTGQLDNGLNRSGIMDEDADKLKTAGSN